MTGISQLLSGPSRADLSRLLDLLAFPNLTDLLANGPDQWWIDTGQGLTDLGNVGISADGLHTLSRFLVELGERHLDQQSPIADASVAAWQFPELERLGIANLRVHAVLESAVSNQTLLSLRVHRVESPSFGQLHKSGMFTDSQAAQIFDIAESRRNFLVTGPAGSGKTTLLRAIAGFNPTLRTVVIEDTAELLPMDCHAVGLQVRQPNIEGAGFIGLEALAAHALRMRPDRLFVGEVRGREIATLLLAMNTGHNGSAATLHANSAQSVRGRIHSLLGESPYASLETLDKRLDESIEAVIHLGFEAGTRKVLYVGELPK